MRRRGSTVAWGMFAVAGIWGIQGCMPDMIEVGRGAGGAIDPGAGGAAGSTVTGPRAGGTAVDGGGGAGGSATGGATAGAGTDGAVPRAGSGGTGGARPNAGHGGTGGSVAAGMGGNVGRAGSGAAAGTGATGGTGTTQDGSDGAAGAPFTYGPAEFGTPFDTVDPDECSLCEGGSRLDPRPGLPACEPCSDPSQNYLNQESLADFCTFHTCPATIAEASAFVTPLCPATPSAADCTISTGCGYTRVGWIHPLGIDAYYFDTRTETLVGAEFGGDQPAGVCFVVETQGGDVPTQACADASTCTLCDYPAGAAGSGSGAAGSTGSGKPPPRCP